MAAQGYIFTDGHWVVARSAAAANAAASSVTSASTISSAAVLGSSGPRPQNAALALPFVGGSFERIRMTTGIGDGVDGALTPIRIGNPQLPRIMIGDVNT
jgi:hypothetical protein